MLKGSGRKRRFLGYGALNVLATNVARAQKMTGGMMEWTALKLPIVSK